MSDTILAADKSVVNLGDSRRFRVTVKKDGSVWNLAGATVTLYLRSPGPDGVTTAYAATIESAADGTAYYDVAADILDTAGFWNRQWKVAQSTVSLRSRKIQFEVEDNLL